jgi:hypothetical protein
MYFGKKSTMCQGSQVTWHHIPGDSNLHIQSLKNVWYLITRHSSTLNVNTQVWWFCIRLIGVVKDNLERKGHALLIVNNLEFSIQKKCATEHARFHAHTVECQDILTYDCTSLDAIACIVVWAWHRWQLSVWRCNVTELITKVWASLIHCRIPTSRLVVRNIIWKENY